MARTRHTRMCSARPCTPNLPRVHVSLVGQFAALGSTKRQEPFIHNEVAYG
jgi:hypothetical protein